MEGTPIAAESDHWGISSAVRLRGPVLELAGRVEHRPLKVLLDSGSTGNFVSEEAGGLLGLKVAKESEWETLTLADGTEVKAAGRVQFT